MNHQLHRAIKHCTRKDLKDLLGAEGITPDERKSDNELRTQLYNAVQLRAKKAGVQC